MLGFVLYNTAGVEAVIAKLIFLGFSLLASVVTPIMILGVHLEGKKVA